MNPASRLNNIVQFFNSVSPNEAMKTAWQRYFDIDESDSEEKVFAATQAVLAEIRFAQAKLKEIEVPQELFNETASILKAAFSPTQLATSWSNHAEVVRRQAVVLALKWASWSLRKFDENDLPEESIKSLKEGLDAQEAMLRGTELPGSLREMLEHQVAELKIALALYKIRGVKPLTDAVNKQIGEMRFPAADVIAEVEKSSQEVKSVIQKGMELIGDAAKIADHGSKVVKFGETVYKLGVSGWQIGQQWLST